MSATESIASDRLQSIQDNHQRLSGIQEAFAKHINSEPTGIYNLQPRYPRRQISLSELPRLERNAPNPMADMALDEGGGSRWSRTGDRAVTTKTFGNTSEGSWNQIQRYDFNGVAARENYHQQIHEMIGQVLPLLTNEEIPALPDNMRLSIQKCLASLGNVGMLRNGNQQILQSLDPYRSTATNFAVKDLAKLSSSPNNLRTISSIGFQLAALSAETDLGVQRMLKFALQCTNHPLTGEPFKAALVRMFTSYQNDRLKELHYLEKYDEVKKYQENDGPIQIPGEENVISGNNLRLREKINEKIFPPSLNATEIFIANRAMQLAQTATNNG